MLAGKYPELDPSALETFLLMLRVLSQVTANMDKFLGQFKMSRGRMMPLMLLYTSGEKSLTASDLADRGGVTRATMTGLLDSLEKLGFVRRIGHQKDRRATAIEITAQGKKVLQKILPPHFRRISRLMKGISDGERQVLAKALKQVYVNISSL